jgi:uncharacterized protein with HEPN domain
MQPSEIEFLRHIDDEVSFCLNELIHVPYDVFVADHKLTRAIVRSLEVIGEASKKISPEFKAKYPLVEWKEMAGMRDRLIHHYFGVDYDLIYKTVAEDMPKLKEWLTVMIKEQ